MSNTTTDGPLVFLLGAGFSIDAASEAGDPMALSSEQPARYPLAHELLNICFGMDDLPSGKSIEDLFQDCIDKGERHPLDTLYKTLMEADYCITPCLKRGGTHEDNAYRKFLKDFPKVPLLTFNYDSLPEILLLGERSWRPEDGYGVRVQAEIRPVQDETLIVDSSIRPVLHLHGSLCVYSATYNIERRPGSEPDMLQFKSEPDFLFDPDTLGHCFFPFDRAPTGITYTYVPDRVIAPVPNKAEGLKGEFTAAVYSQAAGFLTTASQIVAVGYSFNPNDRASYGPLLATASDRSILVVVPDADPLIERLTHEHPDIQWEAERLSFREWVSNGYPGIH